MVTLLIFIVVISVLVFVHEFGHFVFAKRAGMKVEEFGFGFPPRLWGFKKGGTLYSLNWIPFGGFVRIFGEDGDDRSNPQSFGSKSFSRRMGVILAGVAMNFIFAALLLGIGNGVGLRVGLFDDKDIARATDRQVNIIDVAADSPAQTAGLAIFDQIKGFKTEDGQFTAVGTPQEVQDFVTAHTGQTVTLVIIREDQTLESEVRLRENPPPGQGPLGISLALTGKVSYPWYEAIWRGVRDTGILTANTVLGYLALFKNLLFNGKLIADISGPIGIAKMTGQAARVGFTYLIQFVALISVNLAVLNIVPFPALDGGRAFLLLVEKFRGSPLKRKTEGVINAAGFAVLITLMIIVTVRDIAKLF